MVSELFKTAHLLQYISSNIFNLIPFIVHITETVENKHILNDCRSRKPSSSL